MSCPIVIENEAERRKMRVRIAKDVLKALKFKRYYTPARASYLSPTTDEAVEFFQDNGSADAKDNLRHLMPHCKVCALGAMLISLVRLEDNITLSELRRIDYFQALESAGFSRDQSRLIERTYEGWGSLPEDVDLHFAIKRFYHTYAGNTERLRAIMQIIVRNNGDFVMPQRFFNAPPVCFR